MEVAGDLVDHLFRRQAGRMTAALVRIFGPQYLQLAEDVVQEALVRALEQWPHRGIPANPTAWLIEVAKNRALDALRREASLAEKTGELVRVFSSGGTSLGDEMDDQLAMIFLACHPEIPREARVPLTLKTVCGFGMSEIARAFLLQETAAAQRIVRAKRFIRERDLRFALPEGPELAQRRDGVLETLYLMFNEGYSRNLADVIEESIRLARLVADHPIAGAGEADALLALMLLQAARVASRVDPAGDLLLLEDQDRAQWDRGRITEGLRRLDRGARGEHMTAWHIEAGVAAAHATAPDFASTDWAYIADLYDQLYSLNPSPVISLNRAVAISRWKGALEGLRAIEPIEGHPSLARYYLLPATQARLWLEAGDPARAAFYYSRALACGCLPAERRFLERQLAQTSSLPPEPY
jgi:RNA polymerase sigma-70 factor (ECF subfamily)